MAGTLDRSPAAIKAHAPQQLSGALILLFATACGLSVANLYYAQPLLSSIARSLHVGQGSVGLVVTVTQIGYAVGLIALVPLGDLLENRRLIAIVMSAAVIALLLASGVSTFLGFLAASLLIGICSVVAQILVPLVAHLAPEQARGRVVGQVMSGLLAGIVLARAAAGIIAGLAGWRVVYVISAGLLAAMVLALLRAMPQRRPSLSVSYRSLLGSLGRIYLREHLLRRRALYQAAMFGCFSAFWTGITFLLSGAPYHFSQLDIGLFAFAGVLGVLVAPLAGHLGDLGRERRFTGLAFVLAAAAFALTLLKGQLWALILGAIFIDMAVQTTLVLGQRAIYALDSQARSRMNTLYIATFFVGGALGSAGASMLFAGSGWDGVVALGGGLPLLAFSYWLTERRQQDALAIGSTHG